MQRITRSLFSKSSYISNSIKYQYGQLTFSSQLKESIYSQKINTFRCYDLDGKLLSTSIKYNPDQLAKIYRHMIYSEEVDTIMLKIKGQGKISFYMTAFGEYACLIGPAAGLKLQDWIYSQYREQSVFLWRGFTLRQCMNQCIGTKDDKAKGRQMPIHYGSKSLNMPTVSSPLATQIPQAVGVGYSFRVAKQNKISSVFFGEGAASQGDFGVAVNFAATLNCQTLFFCRNNKYAISTPVQDQYASDGVIPRVLSSGMAGMRVDGNDALACLQATKLARQYIIKNRKPFFIQFMTYRLGDHSTSDNSALYRKQDERVEWKTKNQPIKRLKLFLKNINKQIPQQSQIRQQSRKQVVNALHQCQKIPFPSISSLFEDVYDRLPQNLLEQRQQLMRHISEYQDKYDILDQFQEQHKKQ